MNLQHWFTLEILHEYFDNKVCSVFELLPMVSTQVVMKNYNILMQKKENQYSGYVGAESSINSWDSLQMIDDLYFQLVTTDLNFDNYTETSATKERGELLYLTNSSTETNEQDLSTSAYLPIQSLIFQVKTPSELPVSVSIKNSEGEEIFNQLTQKNQSNLSVNISVFGTGTYELWLDGTLSKTFVGISQRIENNCYGILHLQMEPILKFLKNGDAPLFNLIFIARATYWQYAVIVSKDKKITINTLSIESTTNKQYLGPDKKMLGEEVASLFTSPDVKKLHERARASPILNMRYKNNFSDTLLELDIKMPMPNPSHIIIKKENNEDVFYSQTIFYV